MFDNEKYNQIVEKYRKQLVVYCMRILGGDTSLAEETVNDTFRVLYEKWDTLDLTSDIRPFLYETARRCAKHNYAENQRYYKHNESLEEAMGKGQFDNVICFDEYFNDEKNTEESIQKIKSSLPEEYKEIFEIRFIQRKTITETAEILNVPYSSLRYHLIKIEKMVLKEIKKNNC